MKYIQYPVLIGSTGVYVTNTKRLSEATLFHTIGVDFVRVGNNGIFFRCDGPDGLQRRPNP